MQKPIDFIPRAIEPKLLRYINNDRSILLLGPRQTGKTTLIKRLTPEYYLSFVQPVVRIRYEKNPSLLTKEIENVAKEVSVLPLIIIDEIQKVPSIMDVIQDLIDRGIAKFILTGSSARKLRDGKQVNLLPGRVIEMHCDPFFTTEGLQDYSLDELLIYGSLPGIILTKSLEEREALLQTYVSTYLEEEIRAEAIVRNLGHFSQFLTLAANDSGKSINCSKLSQEIGVAVSTISSYYQILEDCLIVERIEPFIISKTHKRLSKTPKYLFFDLGVRRAAALEGTQLPVEYMGYLFEQFIALELIRKLRATSREPFKMYFWRDLNGPEVDWVLKIAQRLIPIEVKWTTEPTLRDARHLQYFIKDYPDAPVGYIVCRTPMRYALTDNIYAIPWQEIYDLV